SRGDGTRIRRSAPEEEREGRRPVVVIVVAIDPLETLPRRVALVVVVLRLHGVARAVIRLRVLRLRVVTAIAAIAVATRIGVGRRHGAGRVVLVWLDRHRPPGGAAAR